MKINVNFFPHFFAVPQKVLYGFLRPTLNLLKHHKEVWKWKFKFLSSYGIGTRIIDTD